MPNYKYVVTEILRVESITVGIQQEIKTLKNRVRAYKGWTKRYRKQQQELKQENTAISKQRDDALQDLATLKIKQEELLNNLSAASQAALERDIALSQLDEVIAKIEQYREICDRLSQMTFARKEDLIREAEKLFFDDPVLDDSVDFDRQNQPQMFEDRASVARYLLDR